jgi:hypothetical protein
METTMMNDEETKEMGGEKGREEEGGEGVRVGSRSID